MNPNLLLAIPLLPLVAALLAGLAGKQIGRAGAAAVTIARGGGCPACCRCIVLKQLLVDQVPDYRRHGLHLAGQRRRAHAGGFLVDQLTALMMVVVTFVSLCVHVYTVGYMRDDPGYQRFFAYIACSPSRC